MVHRLHQASAMTRFTASTSWTLSLVLSLLLLVPRAGLAEEAVAPETRPFQRTELPSSLRLLDAAPEPVPTEDSSPLPRILAVTGVAALTGTMAVASGLRFARAHCTDEKREGYFGCLGEYALGIYAGVMAGVPLGTWLGGLVAGGRGSYLGALVGTSVGAAVGLSSSFVLSRAIHPRAYRVAFPLCTLLGAVIGYEFSHGLNTPGPTVQPLLAVSSRSAALGLGGSF
jgi:hypothetical protein